MYLYNEKFDSPNHIVNAFSKYFSSVYENNNNINLNYNQQNQQKVLQSLLHSCTIDLLDIFNSLNSLTPSSCPEPDLIPSIFFKNCPYVFSTPLLYLFNLSLSTGTFPDAWQTSDIRPVPKSSSDLSNISNYRPISIPSIIPKVVESIVAEKFIPVLANVIVDDGFRRNRSTTNLLVFQNFVSDALMTINSVDVIYTDFAKAFDKINQQILFTKLEQIGVCGSILN